MGLFALNWGGLGREGKRQRFDIFPHEQNQSPVVYNPGEIIRPSQNAAFSPAGSCPSWNYHCSSLSGQASPLYTSVKQHMLLSHPPEAEKKLHSMCRSYSSESSSSSHEHLFYKVVTPSDVGKLNRLVIPKQHAERWFPLDPCLRKKGRLLSFQDVVTKELWWFRYSYWSSSQSYVLTKGWIRFVKDKDLQAGDIISFERGARNELYINCRKRPTTNRSGPAFSLELPHSSPSSALPNICISYSDEDEEEEGVSVTTRLFGVDLRAKPTPVK